jgi:hypothetical protein
LSCLQIEEGHWRELLLERLGPMLSSQGINFQLDVITDYGSDPLQVRGGCSVLRLHVVATYIFKHVTS